MKVVLITQDAEVVQAARRGFQPSDTVAVHADWAPALDACKGADLLFVDLIATLEEPHRIAGYEKFAMAKMAHEKAAQVPLVLIGAADDYELDFMAGWPDFVFAHIRRPVSEKIFRRASTWV
ncbi:MAG: hypothetical protein WAO58_01615 [Fimbriimonadaceae bacterium]